MQEGKIYSVVSCYFMRSESVKKPFLLIKKEQGKHQNIIILHCLFENFIKEIVLIDDYESNNDFKEIF